MISDAMFRELVWRLGGLLLAAIAAFSVIGYLIFLGFWTRTVKPLVLKEIQEFLGAQGHVDGQKESIRKEIINFNNDPANIATRNLAIASEVTRMKNEPVAVMEREREFKTSLENQIRRDDGLVRSEMNHWSKKVGEEQKELFSDFEAEVKKKLEPLNMMNERLVKIEGMLHVLMRNPQSSPPKL